MNSFNDYYDILGPFQPFVFHLQNLLIYRVFNPLLFFFTNIHQLFKFLTEMNRLS